jgi:hypothetical protein
MVLTSVAQATINAQPYALTSMNWGEGVVERIADREGPQDAPTQANLLTPLSVQFGPGVGGFGFNRAGDTPGIVSGFWDCTCDVSEDGYRPPRLEEDSTATGLEVIRASALFKDDLWALWEDGSGQSIVARKYTGSTTTWEGGGTILGTGANSSGLDILAAGQKLWALYATGTSQIAEYSTDGVTWSAAATTAITTGLLTGTVAAHDNSPDGRLAEIDGRVVAAVHHEDNGTITFFSTASTDGDTWADEAIDIPSNFGPLGIAVYQGTDGLNKLYVLAAEGLYEIDVSGGSGSWATPEKVHSRSSSTHPGRNNRLLAQWDGKLWLAEYSAASAFSLVSYSTLGGVRTIETNEGLGHTQGVPSDMTGSIEWLTPSTGGLLASISGGSGSVQARILRLVKRSGGQYAWLPVRKHDTASQHIQWMDVSDRDDGAIRLHYAVRTGSAATSVHFIANPFSPPASGVSIKYESEGYIDLPVVNAGMPSVPKVWLQGVVEADDLSATNSDEHIDWSYGLDGGARTANAVTGDFLSGDKDLDITSTKAGVNGISFGARVTLKRGSTNTNAPILRAFSIDYVPEPQRIRWWEFTIDVRQTAVLQRRTLNMSVVIANLRTAMDAGTQVALRMPGESSDSYVKIKALHDTHPSARVVRSGLDQFQRQGGFVTIRCEESY